MYTVTDLLPRLDDTQEALPARSLEAAAADQRIEVNVSEGGTNSHDVAFETELSEQPWNQRIQRFPASQSKGIIWGYRSSSFM